MAVIEAANDLKVPSYRLRGDAKKLADVGGMLPAGDIIDTGRGVLLLACPACAKIQFAAGEVTGLQTHPTVSRPIHCGNGYCQKCGVWFRVMSGKPEIIEEPKREPTTISDMLKRAGVKPPPVREDL